MKYRNRTRAQLLAEVRRLNEQRDDLAARLAAVVAKLEAVGRDRTAIDVEEAL